MSNHINTSNKAKKKKAKAKKRSKKRQVKATHHVDATRHVDLNLALVKHPITDGVKPVAPIQPPLIGITTWECQHCTYKNEEKAWSRTRQQCKICYTARIMPAQTKHLVKNTSIDDDSNDDSTASLKRSVIEKKKPAAKKPPC